MNNLSMHSIPQDEQSSVDFDALCLEIRQRACTGEFDDQAFVSQDIIEKLKEDEDFGIRSDLSWIYATLAHCHYALGDTKLHQSYDEKFKSLEPLEWQLDTYNKSLQLLIEIL